MMAERTLGVEVPHLQAWRIRKLMKQWDLAKAAGVSRFTVQRAERGERISFDNVRAMAQALGVTPDELRYHAPDSGE
jgi:DNA-binding XRE family transcriptional regulator